MEDNPDDEFENLMIGYIHHSLTNDELKKFSEKLKKSKNATLFKAYIKVNYFSIFSMNKTDAESIIKEIKSRINRKDTS